MCSARLMSQLQCCQPALRCLVRADVNHVGVSATTDQIDHQEDRQRNPKQPCEGETALCSSRSHADGSCSCHALTEHASRSTPRCRSQSGPRKHATARDRARCDCRARRAAMRAMVCGIRRGPGHARRQQDVSAGGCPTDGARNRRWAFHQRDVRRQLSPGRVEAGVAEARRNGSRDAWYEGR